MYAAESFVGKRILITGAGSGIGRASAVLLGRLGANVVLLGRTLGKLEGTAEMIPAGRAEVIVGDLSDFSGYDSIFQRITLNGKLDGMLHCAGIAKAIPVKAMNYSAVKEIFDINLFAFFLLVKGFQKKSVSSDKASIAVCSAVNVHYPQKGMAVYEASKGAVETAVRGMAAELYERRQLRINAMVIGPVATPMGGACDGDHSLVGQQSEITPNLMGIASPDSIAQMAVFLLSDASAYTTGRNFYVDGGRV